MIHSARRFARVEAGAGMAFALQYEGHVRFDRVYFAELRQMKLVGPGPAPTPEVMLTANELAMNVLNGVPITKQSIVQAASRAVGPGFVKLGSFRTRVRENAMAIVAYHRAVTVPEIGLFPHTDWTLPEIEGMGPHSAYTDAFSATVKEAATRGGVPFDIAAKLASLAVEPATKAPSSLTTQRRVMFACSV